MALTSTARLGGDRPANAARKQVIPGHRDRRQEGPVVGQNQRSISAGFSFKPSCLSPALGDFGASRLVQGSRTGRPALPPQFDGRLALAVFRQRLFDLARGPVVQAIRMTVTAFEITSAGRFWPFGPFGIAYR